MFIGFLCVFGSFQLDAHEQRLLHFESEKVPSIRTLLRQKVAYAQLPACKLVCLGFQRVL